MKYDTAFFKKVGSIQKINFLTKTGWPPSVIDRIIQRKVRLVQKADSCPPTADVKDGDKVYCSSVKFQRYTSQELIRYTYPFISESN